VRCGETRGEVDEADVVVENGERRVERETFELEKSHHIRFAPSHGINLNIGGSFLY
jgi:hypothetical protein